MRNSLGKVGNFMKAGIFAIGLSQATGAVANQANDILDLPDSVVKSIESLLNNQNQFLTSRVGTEKGVYVLEKSNDGKIKIIPPKGEVLYVGKDEDKSITELNNNRGNTVSDVSITGNNDALNISSNNGLTGVEYSEKYGVIYNIGMQLNPDNTVSFIVKGSIGEKEKRILAGAGYKVSEKGLIMFMGEHFRQEREIEGNNVDLSQNKIAVSFKIDGYDFTASKSKSGDVNLKNSEVIIDSSNLWQKYSVSKKFDGQDATRFSLGKDFEIGDNSILNLSIGNSKIDGKNVTDGGVRFTYYMGKDGKWDIEVSKTGENTKVGVGYEGNASWVKSGATWKIQAEHIDGVNGYSDNRLGAYLNIPFGSDSIKSFDKTVKSNQDIGYELKNFINVNKSYMVLGEVKETGRKLLVEIDKTGFGAGMNLNSNTGVITVSGLNAFTGLTSITRNGVPVSSSAFTVVGNTLQINSGLLPEPAVGVNDTWELTTNGVPANTITMVVAKGSVIIQSVVVGTVIVPDTTPDSYDVTNMTNQSLSTVVTTNAVTVSGLNQAVTATTNLGTIVKNGTDTGLTSTTVNNGDTVAIRLTTSGTNSTTQNGTLTIGTASDNFSVTTEALVIVPDTTPDSYDVTNMTNQLLSTVVTTNAVTVSGLNQAVTATTNLGTIVKNGTDTGLTSTTVNNGDTVAIRLTTSGTNSTTQNGTLTIGTASDNFSVTTEALAPLTPDLSGIPSTFTASSDFGPHSFDIGANCVNCTGGAWSIISWTGNYGLTGTSLIVDRYGGSMSIDSNTGIISGLYDTDEGGNISVNVRYTKDGINYDKTINLFIPEQG